MRWEALLFVGFWAATAAAQGDSEQTGSKRLYDKVLAAAIEREGVDVRDEAKLREDHSTWENAWRVESEHYEVRTTQSRAFALDIAQGLDAMLRNFQSILDTDYLPPKKLPIYVFPNLPEYNKFGEQFGQEHSSYMGAFYSTEHPDRAVATYYVHDYTLMRMWITHAAAHQYIAAAFPQTPPLWVGEGLAAYFEMYWGYNYGIDELARLKSVNRWIPVRRLLTEGIKDYEANGHDRWMELGMLFTYLMWEREDTKATIDERGRVSDGPFVGYLRVVLNGGNPRGLAVHSLLTDDLAQLDEDLQAYEFKRR